MTQMCTLKVKPISFQVTEHLFDPHPAAISTQRLLSRWQVGRQQPGFLFPSLPMRQQVGRVRVLGRQQAASQPVALARLLHQVSEILPVAFADFYPVIGLLPQDVGPFPAFQLPHDRYGAKFAVSDQQNGRCGWYQASHISQQGQLFDCRTVSFALHIL